MALGYKSFLIACCTMLCACGSSRQSTSTEGELVCDANRKENGIHWKGVDDSVLSGYSAMPLPSAYQVYAIDKQQLKRYFSAADKSSSSPFVVPVNDQKECKEYSVARSEILPDSLKKKYPQLVSLKGTGTRGDDIRLDYDGNVLQGQIISDGEMYYITPLNHNGKTFHIVYKRSDSKEIKQEFERP